ncbi:carbohydrate binding-domain-containing protein [Mycena galopus ATCC 62051]|nr:carbohydrate binding-domain-containing protein [Mycena galopus ATCC 62051]
MARFLSIAILFTALTAGLVLAQDLATCGTSNYYPSQYTCFDDDFLCPIVDGDVYLQCALINSSCSDTTLEPISDSGSESLEDCGNSQFYPSQYVCLDGDILCPFMNGAATLNCGTSCYDPTQFECTSGQLSPVVTPPTCVPDYGVSEVCNDEGCFQLLCCPGLISVADRCRDPCELAPASCGQ